MRVLEIEILKQYPRKIENHYAEKILQILRASPVPLSLSLLSAWTGVPKYRLCKVLKKLSKYYPEKIRKVTIAKDSFYRYTPSTSRSTFLAIIKVRK
jgi:hypothetical protein